MFGKSPFLRAGPAQVAELASDVAAQSAEKPYTEMVEHKGVKYDIQVYLDNRQRKHQPPGAPIGSDETHGGSKLPSDCNYEWHMAATMPVVAAHAADALRANKLPKGERYFPSVQSKNFDTIKTSSLDSFKFQFEAIYMLEESTVIVLFHCYPAR